MTLPACSKSVTRIDVSSHTNLYKPDAIGSP